jgi:hypothetical protein
VGGVVGVLRDLAGGSFLCSGHPPRNAVHSDPSGREAGGFGIRGLCVRTATLQVVPPNAVYQGRCRMHGEYPTDRLRSLRRGLSLPGYPRDTSIG